MIRWPRSPHEALIRQWLGEGLRLTKIHRRRRAQGVTASYSSLYRFARAVGAFGALAVTVRVADPPPGESRKPISAFSDSGTTRPRVGGAGCRACC
jgi:hypothetical protein